MRVLGERAFRTVAMPANEPAAAHRDQNRRGWRALVEQLERERALAGGRPHVLERVDEHGARLLLERAGGEHRVVVGLTRLADLDGEAAQLVDLGARVP